jgi:hypothetical protein
MNIQKKKFKEFNGHFRSSLILERVDKPKEVQWKVLLDGMGSFCNENFKKNDYL